MSIKITLTTNDYKALTAYQQDLIQKIMAEASNNIKIQIEDNNNVLNQQEICDICCSSNIDCKTECCFKDICNTCYQSLKNSGSCYYCRYQFSEEEKVNHERELLAHHSANYDEFQENEDFLTEDNIVEEVVENLEYHETNRNKEKIKRIKRHMKKIIRHSFNQKITFERNHYKYMSLLYKEKTFFSELTEFSKQITIKDLIRKRSDYMIELCLYIHFNYYNFITFE